MCGGERSNGYSPFCCARCAEAYAEVHSSQLINAGIVSDEWSYRARCAASMALIGDDITSTDEADADRFKKSVNSLETLKYRLMALRRELPSDQVSTPSQSASQMREWIASFDKLMRNLDVIFSDEFAAKLTEHVVEFDNIHRSTDSKTTSMLEVKKLLADIARAVPMNRLIADKRALLQNLLDNQAPKIKDKLVLTLDGGGMRGMVTLVLLIELLRLVRIKSGKPNALLSDCFHMIVGTSTGGIIAALIAVVNMPLEEILRLYSTMGSRVFGSQSEVTGTLDPMTMMVHYSDHAMLEFLLQIFGTRRLDDDATRFKDDSLRGPNGVRFAVATLNMDQDPSEPMLLRNYEVPSGPLVLHGTNRCFVVESIRSTTSAITYIHPYARHYAPLKTVVNAIGQTKTDYEMDASGAYRDNLRIILDSAATKQERDKLAKLSKGDQVMNTAVTVDGGTFANNPTEVAIQDARELYAQDQVNLIVANFGTGLLPSTKNRTWSHGGIRNPAERKFLGEHNMRDVLKDLINGGVVSPSTDTERTAKRVNQLYGQFASITRVNPPLRKAFRLDDFSDASAKEMMEDTNAFKDSREGQEILGALADKIVTYSDKLRSLPTKP